MKVRDLNTEVSVYEFVRASYELHGKKGTSIVFYGTKMTFPRFLKEVDRFAEGLKSLGIGKGSVVTLCLPNIPQNMIAFYAIAKVGAVSDVIHPLTPIKHILEDMDEVKSQLLITSDVVLAEGIVEGKTVVYCEVADYMDFAHRTAYKLFKRKKKMIKAPDYISYFDVLNGKLDRCAQCANDAPILKNAACILHSGGTTGKPKKVVISHFAMNRLMSKHEYYLKDLDMSKRSLYGVLPSFHGFGLCMNMHICAVFGTTQVMSMKFNSREAIRLVHRHKIDFINGVPSIFYSLIKHKQFNGRTAASLNRCYVGGDNVPIELVKRFNKTVTGDESKMRIFEGYGLTETIAVVAINTPEAYKFGSSGKALPGCRIEVAEKGVIMPRGSEGEIVITGDTLMEGYYGVDEADNTSLVSIDGIRWLLSGDWGYVDEDGFVFFKQRIKHVIMRKGVNVFPSEVEEVINRLDYVKRCCVVGKDKTGEGTQTVYAYVHLTDKYLRTDKTKKAIQDFVASHLIRFAVPEQIIFTARFPKTAIGKVDVKYFEERDD